MIRNYLTIALRTLGRHKGYSFINIVGFAVGLASFVLILLYVQDERSYDRYHGKADRIYRVVEIIEGSEESASQPFPAGPTLRQDFPHLIEASVRFFNMQAPSLLVEYEAPSGEKVSYNEPRVFFVDSTVFDVFDFSVRLSGLVLHLSRHRAQPAMVGGMAVEPGMDLPAAA